VEEWIYGAPPQDVIFIRFTGDEVTQIETMKMGGPKIVKTEKEVDVKDGVVSMASIARQGESPSADPEATRASAPQPAQRPTLRRPDEAPDDAVRRGSAVSVPEHKDTPQWGSDGQERPPVDLSKPPAQLPSNPPNR
jgi:hypothetical protein